MNEIKYAFVSTCGIQDNYKVKGEGEDGIDAFVARIIVAYDLLDIDRTFVRQETRFHVSEPAAQQRTVAEVTEWVAATRNAAIANDKLELAGYQQTIGE